MRKKRTNWTEQKIAVLIQLYPIETTPRTAEILGMCERAVKGKGPLLGAEESGQKPLDGACRLCTQSFCSPVLC